MWALVIDDEAKVKAAEVLQFALAHPYYLGSKTPPGDDPRYCCQLNSYRCVFSLTIHPRGVQFRHLSISLPNQKYPHPIVATEIADLFGFSKAEQGIDARMAAGAWIVEANKTERCLTIVEQL